MGQSRSIPDPETSPDLGDVAGLARTYRRRVTIAQLFEAVAQLSRLVFVVTSMLPMGMSLTIAQIVEPMRNARLVVLALTDATPRAASAAA